MTVQQLVNTVEGLASQINRLSGYVQVSQQSVLPGLVPSVPEAVQSVAQGAPVSYGPPTAPPTTATAPAPPSGSQGGGSVFHGVPHYQLDSGTPAEQASAWELAGSSDANYATTSEQDMNFQWGHAGEDDGLNAIEEWESR